MSIPEARSAEASYTLWIEVSPDLKTQPNCTVRVRRETTVAMVIRSVVPALQLNEAENYELLEVREVDSEFKGLQADECPVKRMMFWPEGHEQSCGYYFLLQKARVGTKPLQDLCCLPVLDEDSILEMLRRRFDKNQIYTYASDLLIAVNPFKFLPIYNPKDVKSYENCNLGSKEPHIFAIADAAFRAMVTKRVDQCIVISGESGSGKTQSTNFLIHCLTTFSRKGLASGVERTILGAGPVLEAFGNAKTEHNNNSSRFGKFIQVNFLEGGIVRGATIEKYLLEKCRLVSRKSSERNYHVFYYLLVGASQEERDEFKLLEPEDYHYLKQDNPHLENKAEMIHKFTRLHQAMEMVGFLPATKKQMFSVLSAILYLGNVRYQVKADGDGVTVGPADVLQTLSDLLQVRVQLLVEALTQRRAMTANDVLILPYSLIEATTARDSMAKSLYSSLFDWIVLRINHALLNKRDVEEAVPLLSIGVLDIFGFEDFKDNSFEQFCINYANEQLQHYCNQYIFWMEQEEYAAEGISWTSVDYTDNVGCIHLISKKPTGLLHLLDEESSLPHATHATLLEKFKRQHHDNHYFVPTPVLEPAFVILHYAGKVKYSIKDFRDKNTDHMRPDIVALLRSSERGYLRQLIGSNPVAVFRWGILRATVRAMFIFKKAGQRCASKHPDKIRRYSRNSLSGMRRASTAIDQLMSQQTLIDFSFDRSEENPLELLEDIFASFEKKKKSRSGRNKQLIPKNLMTCQSLKLIVDLNLHNRDTRALLHLHKKKKPPSISAQFQTSLLKLLETLKKAEPFFVRCIRSNAMKREMHFDGDLVLRQLRYTGMLQTVRIKRSGYGAKYTFKEFAEEFRILLPRKCSSLQSDIVDLLRKSGLDEKAFQIGKTKVFLKETESQLLRERLHDEVMRRILILQRWFRACLARKQFLMKKKAIVIVQRSWRVYRDSTRYRAALVIQMAWKDSHHRSEYLRQRDSLKKLQQLKSRSEQRRLLKEEWMNKSDGSTNTSPNSEGANETGPLPRGKNKPLPPIPTHGTPPNGHVQGRQDGPQQNRSTDRGGQTVPEQRKKDDKEEKNDRQVSVPPAQPRPDFLPLEGSPKSEDGTGQAVLQRAKPGDMKGKVEKWRERRSEIALMDQTNLTNQKMINLKARGISMSLDNLSRLSSSESDSSYPPEVTLRRRKRSRHKRRLGHARSGLMLHSGEAGDVEYWSFPLPPISPSSFRASAPVGLVKSQLASEYDGAKMSAMKGSGEAGPAFAPPEKSGFFNRYFQKKRATPQDGTATIKFLDKEEVKSPHSYSPTLACSISLVKRKRSIQISRGTRNPDQGNASLERQISDANELRHLDEFLGNQVNDLQSRMKKLSETEQIFLLATRQFRENIKSMYSLSNYQISYKGLLQDYKGKVAVLAMQKKKRDEVPMVVNLFQTMLDGFIRVEIKRASSETELSKPTKKVKRTRENDKCPDSPLDHSFCTYQVSIMQSCDMCGSFIWVMEKACMCSSCKMVCHRKCLSKILTPCSKLGCKKAEAGKACFGIHLRALCSSEMQVPQVLEMMLVHVEVNGLYTEGIYRKSGSACKGKELHQILQTDPQSAHLDNYQIHTVTGLIKSWLRELPEPLMTFNLYNDFLCAADVREKSERLRAIYKKLEALPSFNFSTLERLIFHLVRVVKEEAHNRMTANALAIVFAPCVLRCPDFSDPLLSVRDLPKTTQCLEVLIQEQTRKYEEKMREIQQLEHAEALAVNELKLRRQNTIIENPKSQQDTSEISSNLDVEKKLIEKIRSLKKEKNNLAYRLPDLDQDTSDNETLDSESTVSLESPLEENVLLLDSEGVKKTKEPSKPPVRLPKQTQGCARLTSIHEGQTSFVLSHNSQDSDFQTQFTDLDIPFIDDEM